MKKTQIPTFASKAEQFDWLISNKALLIAEKKATTKQADALFAIPEVGNNKADEADKQADGGGEGPDISKIVAKLVINTTNVMDSHSDVHMKGIWKKSLSEQSQFYLLQEHDMSFEGVITDEVAAYTKAINWATLGAPFTGTTEALMFDATIKEDRNEYMFEQYLNRWVKNHSVGMRYVKLFLCINDQSYAEEYANWEKYIPEVVNRADAEAQGYFWAVTEAKIIEGSAVLMGSNKWTPVQSQTDDITEPMGDSAACNTPQPKSEPLHSTQIETPIVEQTKSTFLNPNLY